MTDQTSEAVDPSDPNTYTFDTAIVGVRFYQGAAELLSEVSPDGGRVPGLLTLVREPDNQYDHNAIAVHFDGKKVGHIPAPQAKILAPRLDAGRKVLGITRRNVTGLVLTLEKDEDSDTTETDHDRT